MNKHNETFTPEHASVALTRLNPYTFTAVRGVNQGNWCCEMQCQHNNTDSLETHLLAPRGSHHLCIGHRIRYQPRNGAFSVLNGISCRNEVTNGTSTGKLSPAPQRPGCSVNCSGSASFCHMFVWRYIGHSHAVLSAMK